MSLAVFNNLREINKIIFSAYEMNRKKSILHRDMSD